MKCGGFMNGKTIQMSIDWILDSTQIRMRFFQCLEYSILQKWKKPFQIVKEKILIFIKFIKDLHNIIKRKIRFH